MSEIKKNKKLNIGVLVCIFVMAIVLGFVASAAKLTYSYEWAGDNNIALSGDSYEYLSDNVEYGGSEGTYEPLNDDPWILYKGINDEFRGVIISLKEPAKVDIPVKLYWTRTGDEALSERNTIEKRIKAGESSAYIGLPRFGVNILRFDIDGSTVIDSISLSKNSIVKTRGVNSEFLMSLLLKTLVILIVLYIAYLSHVERVANGSHLIKGVFINENIGAGHKVELDYIRTLAAILVIMMHSVIDLFAPQVSIGEPGYLIIKLFLSVSLVCNALFIMLSGALLLQPKEETIADFYKKRLGKVLIPTLSYYLLYMIQGYSLEVFENGFGQGLKEIGLGLLTSRPKYMLHMWFIYAILGLYILAPFLRIMLSHITEGQLFGLIIAGFICDAFASILPAFKLSFGIETPLASWMGVFLLGYYMTTEHAKKKYKAFMIFGVLALVATCILVYYYPGYLYYESNWAPLMWLEGAGIFAFFTYYKNIFGKRNVVVESLAKYNFSIMLIHVLLLMKVILPIGWRYQAQYGHLTIFIVGMILVCLVLSYIASVLYDNTAIAAANYIYKKIIWRKK